MNKTLKIVLISVIAVVVIAAITLGSMVLATLYKKRDTRGTPFESEYVLDESGCFIANIAFEKYLYEPVYDESETLFDIRDYGADPNADFGVNREAINDAIAAANAAGGGVVLVDGGEYRAANVRLLSNVCLRIASGSALVNIDYATAVKHNKNYFSGEQNDPVYNGFIYAVGEKNVSVEGPGKIKCNGATYCDEAEDDSLFYPLSTFNLKTYVLEHRKRIMPGKDSELNRYYAIAFTDCENVRIYNLEIYESASWTCRMEANRNLTFSNVVINNNIRVANSDGIDIVGGENTLIENCFIATGDDAVCLKTEKGGEPVHGFILRDSEITSLANCFKTGTDTFNDISDIEVYNCKFFMPGIAGGYAGIALEATDGGTTSDVYIHDIEMFNVTSPLLIWLGNRGKGSSLQNVRIERITATETDLPSAITGCKDRNVENVTVTDFYVTYREAASDLDIYRGDDAYSGRLNMAGYPEITRVSHKYIISHALSAYWDLPVYGLYVRYAENVVVNNFNAVPRSDETRPATNL